MKQNTEFWLGLVVKTARAVTDRCIRPTRVECPHPRTDDLEEFERFFGCPVKFSAPSGLLEFSNETLALPLITQDASLLQMLQPFCEEAEKARNAATGSLRDAVESEVERLLPNGRVKAETVAMALAISVETLSRRLSGEGTSFAASLTNCAKASRSAISRNRASRWRRSHGFWVTSARLRSHARSSVGQAARRPPSATRIHREPGSYSSELAKLPIRINPRFSLRRNRHRGAWR